MENRGLIAEVLDIKEEKIEKLISEYKAKYPKCIYSDQSLRCFAINELS